MFKSADNNKQLMQENHQTLLSHLLANKGPLTLKYIKQGKVYFESNLKYPLSNGDVAVYLVTASIPLTSPIFQSEEVFYVYPSKIQDSVMFTFISLQDKNG